MSDTPRGSGLGARGWGLEASIVCRCASDPDRVGRFNAVGVFGRAATGAVDCAIYRRDVDRNSEAWAGLRCVGGDWLGGRPTQPALFDDRRAEFCGNAYLLGFEFPGLDQRALAVEDGGPRFGRRRQLFKLAGHDCGQPGASLREPGGRRIAGPPSGEARVAQRVSHSNSLTFRCCNPKVVYLI